MNGQLSEHPLAELIREISAKRLSGRLRVEQNRIKAVVYFLEGSLVYAACNVRTLRLSEYLQKSKLVSDQQLAGFQEQRSDLALAATLCAQKILDLNTAEQLQVKQVSDILRVALLWTEGTWEFDYRSHLNEQVSFKIDTPTLLLEAGRRIPPKFAASRFRNPKEVISPLSDSTNTGNLSAPEGFLLSRLQGPTILHDLIALSGQQEPEALRLIYALGLGGFLLRGNWKSAFRNNPALTKEQIEKKPDRKDPLSESSSPAAPAVAEYSVDEFLRRLRSAATHYEVLGVAGNAQPAEIKAAYYELARHYHPDRFRRTVGDALHAEIESAFARITQAYETLMETGPRATYDSKLSAQERARGFARSAPEASNQTPRAATTKIESDKVDESAPSDAQRAEANFKEGFAALQQGLTNSAISLLSSAASLVPNDPRYRAYYGQALAAHEKTRRLAEVELQTALKLEPNNSQYRVMLAELYRDLGFALRARGEAERATAADPNNSKARELLRSLK